MNRDIIDAWSLAHISFGITVFYLTLAITGRRQWWMPSVIIVAGFAWELLENNPWFKRKLRGWGFPDYYGDSGRNMMTDQMFNIIGFSMAFFGPRWFVLLPALNEVLMWFMIGDNTTLAILRAIKAL